MNGTYDYTDFGELIDLIALFDPLMRAISLILRVLAIRREIWEQRCSQSISICDSSGRNGELIGHCCDLLDEFDRWDQDAKEYWQMMFENRTQPTILGEAQGSQSHYDTETACTIILLRSSRLILLLSLADHFHWIFDYDVADGLWNGCLAQLEHDMESTISDMLRCVPYALGDLDAEGRAISTASDGSGALVIFRSIWMVATYGHSTPAQALESQRILKRMSESMGIRSAAVVAQTEANGVMF